MSQIKQNTTDLQAILEAVKALPEAGGGSSGPFAVVSVTEGSPVADFESVVNISTGSEVTWEKYYTHFLYNGVRLPRIPEDVIADFPYCWMNNLGDGTFSVIVAAHPWYYQSGKMNLPVSAENRKYTLASTVSEWVLSKTYTDTGGYSVTDSYVMWASHDIPNGSATATDIYFEGTEPVPVD